MGVAVIEKNYLRSKKRIGKKEMIAKMRSAEDARQQRLAGKEIATKLFKGKVKEWDSVKGMGEITRDDGQIIKVHRAALEDELQDLEVGAKCRFEVIIVHNDGGVLLQAAKVRLRGRNQTKLEAMEKN